MRYPRLSPAVLAAAVLAAVALGGALPAQGAKVVPPTAAAADASTSSYFPFLYDKTIVQQLWDSSAITSGKAVMTAIKFRRDAANKSTFQGRTFTTTVRLGYSPNSAKSMSQAFASNWKGTPVVIFSGTYNLPAQPPVARGPAPWNVVYTMSNPFLYDPANGNLLMEWVVPGQATRKHEYFLDADVVSQRGTTTPFGTTGRFAGGDRVFMRASGVIAPAGSFSLRATGLRKRYPAVGFLGTSRGQWLGLRLPLDLAPFGAPTNTLYTGLEASFPMPLSGGPSVWTAQATLTVPNNPSYSGRTLYAQAYLIDLPSNRLGAVFTNAASLTFGGGTGFTQVLAASDSSAARGFFLFGNTAQGGPVVRFEGAIP